MLAFTLVSVIKIFKLNMVKMRIILLMAAIFMVGCEQWDCKYDSTPNPGSTVRNDSGCSYSAECGRVYYCPNYDVSAGAVAFTVDQMNEINKAMTDWEISLNHTVDFSSKPGCIPIKFISTNSSEPEFRTEPDSMPELDRGFDSGTSIWINQDRTCGIFVFGDVVRHEIGHIIGLKHTWNPKDLMFYEYSSDSPGAVTSREVEQYQDVYKCCVQ